MTDAVKSFFKWFETSPKHNTQSLRNSGASLKNILDGIKTKNVNINRLALVINTSEPQY